MFSRLKLEEGWFTFLLVWGLVMVPVAAILNAQLIDGLEILPIVSSLAVFAGLVLAKSSFRARTAHLFALFYGLFIVTYLIGRNLPGDLIWQERIFDLISRQYVWLSKALSQGSSRDGLIFVIHTSAVFWLLGYTAAWYTFRTPRMWRVILPSGLVLLSVIYYYYGPKPLVGFLALYTFIALIYVARTHLVAREKVWRSRFVRFEEGIRFSFLQASILAALLALIVAWGLPTAQASSLVSDTLGESGVSETWRGFQDNWTRLFSSLRSYGTGTADTYHDSLSLGGARTVGNSLIMDVHVPERIPYVYWQAVAYDTYEDGRWSISDSDDVLHFPDDGKIDVAYSAMRQEVVQSIVNFVPNSGTIYGAPEIANSDRQMYVTQSADDRGNAVIHMARSRFVLQQGEKYEVVSRYSTADATNLRRAPQNYPQWISEKYLQVPESITPETVQLAEQLTSEFNNPFDKAIAIRNYLRANIDYNDQIDAPPDGVEPVHYILFDRQEAYCNYYASSMIMMLRSQGVPARFVAGYAQGEWDEESSSYRVRANNSHAWVEVFFPGYGWIQFEPTASLPPGDRPETSGNPGDAFGAESLAGDSGDESLNDPQIDEQDQLDQLEEFLLGEEDVNPDNSGGFNQATGWKIAGAVTILFGAVGVVIVASYLNNQVESSIDKSYDRLGRWAPRVGVLIRPAHTPYERANLLATVLPEGKESLRSLTHEFVRRRFSPHRADNDEFNPRNDWKVLRPMFLRGFFNHQISRMRNRKKDK